VAQPLHVTHVSGGNATGASANCRRLGTDYEVHVLPHPHGCPIRVAFDSLPNFTISPLQICPVYGPHTQAATTAANRQFYPHILYSWIVLDR
jgi:hypothetical protein